MTKLKFYNYEYRDPRDSTPIWVGKGQGQRAYDHLNPKKKKVCSPGLTAAIAEYRALGLEPVIQIVEYFAVGTEAYAAERGRIAQYGRRSSGTGPLYNRKPGGEVPKQSTYRFGVDPKPPTYRPHKVLTDTIINKLKPARPDKRYIVPDWLVLGLGVCVTDSGHRTYVLSACYPDSTHYERREIGEVNAMSLDEARDTACDWLAEIDAEYTTIWAARKAVT